MTGKARNPTETSRLKGVTRRATPKRSDLVAVQIKEWIIDQGLRPGDRLPQEKDLIETFGMSKGTIREGLKALEVQGLIRMRPGPGGGGFIDSVSEDQAIALLGNYFFSQDVTIKKIFFLRKLLEPEVVVSVIGRLSSEDFRRLEETMDVYSNPPRDTKEEYVQRMKELDFHGMLADICPNPLLAFTCKLVQTQLKTLAVCRRIFETPQPGLRQRGWDYQKELLDALKAQDHLRARQVMYEHMCEAERIMLKNETIIVRNFLDRATA